MENLLEVKITSKKEAEYYANEIDKVISSIKNFLEVLEEYSDDNNNDLKNKKNKIYTYMENIIDAKKRMLSELENLREEFDEEFCAFLKLTNILGWYLYKLDEKLINKLKYLWKDYIYEVKSLESKGSIIENFDYGKVLNEKAKVDETDNYISNIVKSNLETIKKSLKENFPHRNIFIDKIFKNFKKKNYIECLLLALTQSDGMFCEIIELQLYSKSERGIVRGKKNKRKENKLVSYLEQAKLESNDFVYTAISMLEQINIINENKDFRLCIDNPTLNRNTILHGTELLSYNEINCLKIISLLDLITKLKERYREVSGEKNMQL
ncbi:hypothetical protein OQL13_000536 [Clostridium perfringens]